LRTDGVFVLFFELKGFRPVAKVGHRFIAETAFPVVDALMLNKAGGYAKEFLGRLQNDNATGLAAQLAYYFLLSLFPFIIFAVTMLGYTHITADDVLSLVDRYVPAEALEPLEENIRDVLKARRGLLSFSILATIWSASRAMDAIVDALNRAYNVEEERPFLRAKVMGVALTFILIFIILISLTLPVLGQWIGRLLFTFLNVPTGFAVIWELTRWAFSFSVMIAGFAFIYYFAPNKRLKITAVAIGALFTASGWQIASLAFSFYVGNFANYSATYGSLGAVIVLMLWFYLVALIIIMGGELNAMIDSHRKDSE
jgi:membrane protein